MNDGDKDGESADELDPRRSPEKRDDHTERHDGQPAPAPRDEPASSSGDAKPSRAPLRVVFLDRATPLSGFGERRGRAVNVARFDEVSLSCELDAHKGSPARFEFRFEVSEEGETWMCLPMVSATVSGHLTFHSSPIELRHRFLRPTLGVSAGSTVRASVVATFHPRPDAGNASAPPVDGGR